MKRIGKFLLIAFGVVVLLIASVYIYIARPISDGRTPAERRQIADACFAMLHSSLTNEVDDIKMEDPRIPEVIRALHPHHIEVTPNFAVDIYRVEWPQEYFLTRGPGHTNTWILCVAGPSLRFGGGGREILRIEHN
ncbi:MAG: hypothetical protein JWQ04_294 [Pedosphaera sp.]|nr:hypothetical protein [Pedosphaera sp.]